MVFGSMGLSGVVFESSTRRSHSSVEHPWGHTKAKFRHRSSGFCDPYGMRNPMTFDVVMIVKCDTDRRQTSNDRSQINGRGKMASASFGADFGANQRGGNKHGDVDYRSK